MSPTTPARRPGLPWFIFTELLGYLRAYFFPFLLAGVLFLIWCGFVIYQGLKSPPPGGPSPAGQTAVAITFLCFTAVPPLLAFATVVGTLRFLWRAAGVSAFIPILLIPIGVVLAVWFALPLLGSQLFDLGKAYVLSFHDKGTPMTDKLLSGGSGGGGHAGGPFAIILLIIALPGLLLDAAGAALSLDVFWKAFVCMATLGAVVFVGAFVFGFPSLFLAGRAFVRRTRGRWQEMQAKFDAAAPALAEAEEARKASGT